MSQKLISKENTKLIELQKYKANGINILRTDLKSYKNNEQIIQKKSHEMIS